MTSSNLEYLLKAQSSGPITLGVRASTHFRGDHSSAHSSVLVTEALLRWQIFIQMGNGKGDSQKNTLRLVCCFMK